MKRPFILPTLAAALVLASIAAATARDVVEIRVRGYYYAEPATVQITIAVEPDAENRALRVEAESEHMFRASEMTLSGELERRIHNVEFRNLPAGTYMLSASVHSSTGMRGVARQELIVSGGGR